MVAMAQREQKIPLEIQTRWISRGYFYAVVMFSLRITLPSMAFIQNLAYQIIVIGENGINAHIQELLGFLGIIGPEYVTDNAVGMGFVDHSLVEVGFKQLDLFTTVP